MEGFTFASEEQAQDMCEQLQALMGLQDWDVTVHIVGREATQGNQGVVSYVVAKKIAIISLLDQSEYGDERIEPQDHERTLIHELNHLHFAALDPLIGANPLADFVLEQGIHAQSVAFVQLLRAARGAATQTETVEEAAVADSSL